MVERSLSMREVGGSIPPFSTAKVLHLSKRLCRCDLQESSRQLKCNFFSQLLPEYSGDAYNIAAAYNSRDTMANMHNA